MRSEEEVRKLDTKRVSCKILYESVDPTRGSADPKKLIINVHGGGFCLGTFETNDVYLRYWTRKTPGLGVVSIDISLAPEHKFPVAMQEIADVYDERGRPTNEHESTASGGEACNNFNQ